MNKTIVITGANSGIGKALTYELQNSNKVIMICRDSEKSRSVLKDIRKNFNDAQVELITGDLSNPKDMKEIIDKLLKIEHVDVLINNAGLIKKKKELSVDQIEMTFAVNYLAVYRLTMGLIEGGITPKKIINITSELFKKGKVDIDDIIDPKKFNGSKAYNNSKMALMHFSYEIVNQYGDSTSLFAVHPGVIATNVFREYPKWVSKLLNKFLEKPESAAKKISELVSSDDMKPGYYYNQNKIQEQIESYVNKELSHQLMEFSKTYTV
jgi:NAD(P)-dependent dehydrogenase (short-subunit alcohol dehydrogenase family)